MNEILEQRINSIQMGKNATHAQIEAKRSLRDQLEHDLEKFFARGGEVKKLDRGFTHFKNGILPAGAPNAVRGERDRIDREKAIEAKNEEIRKYKAALKEQRRSASKQKAEAQMKEQAEVLGQFVSKFPSQDDFKRLSEIVGYQTRHLRDAARGHTKLAVDRWELVKKAVKTFKSVGAA